MPLGPEKKTYNPEKRITQKRITQIKIRDNWPGPNKKNVQTRKTYNPENV